MYILLFVIGATFGLILFCLIILPLIGKLLRWIEYRNGDLWVAENDFFWEFSYFIWEKRNKNN